jgi:hypothetical protein
MEMPLAKYASSFGPIELENMTAAFEAAWKQLSTSTGINLSTPSQIHLVRSRLAECIVVWAEIGVWLRTPKGSRMRH